MKNILTIDDDESFLYLLEEMLKDECDANVTRSINPIEALALAQEEKYDLIISDYSMPKMNGSDLVKAIRLKAGANQLTPIVLLTGNTDLIPADIKELKSVNFFDKIYYLTNLPPYLKVTFAKK